MNLELRWAKFCRLPLVLGYHIEEVTNLCSFGQVPHINVPIVASRQHDAGVEWVSLHDKHLVIVTLEEYTSFNLDFYPEFAQQYQHFGHLQITHAAAAQWLSSTL